MENVNRVSTRGLYDLLLRQPHQQCNFILSKPLQLQRIAAQAPPPTPDSP